MFGSIFSGEETPPDLLEDALDEADIQVIQEHELARLARAFLCCSDPNERFLDARRVLRARLYLWLDEIVRDLKEAGVRVKLRPMGARPVDQRKLNASLEVVLRSLLGGAAGIRARMKAAAPYEMPVPTPVATTIVLRGVEAAMLAVGATGRGYKQTTQVLAGRVLELAGLTERHVVPEAGIDDARMESVRRSKRRAPATFRAELSLPRRPPRRA